MDRCEIHRLPLDLDPIRGPICPACDAEVMAGPDLRWLRRLAWRISRWFR